MNKFQLVLCDDEEFFINDIKQYLKAYESESGNEMITTSYSSGVDLLKSLKENKIQYDIFFLDVDMPEMKGTQVAKEIRKMYPDAVICFITAFEEYAYEAFQAEALGYLVKPVKYADLRHMLNRCAIQVQYTKDAKEAELRYIEVKTKRGTNIICVDDILYIEKRRNQCVFHLEDGEFVCYNTLAGVYEKLNKSMFYFVHQGYIVNFAQIREVKAKVVCLGKDREVPISRKYQAKMREMHMEKIMNLQVQRKILKT